MPNHLILCFQKHGPYLACSKLLHQFLEGGQVLRGELLETALRYLPFSEMTFKQYEQQLATLACLSTYYFLEHHKDHELQTVLIALYWKIVKNGFPDYMGRSFFYRYFICTILGIAFEESFDVFEMLGMPNSTSSEPKHHWIKPFHSIEIATFLLIIGLKEEKESFIRQSYQILQNVMRLLIREGQVLSWTWIEEENYSRFQVPAFLYILYTLHGMIFDHEELRQHANACIQEIERDSNENIKKIPELAIVLSFLGERLFKLCKLTIQTDVKVKYFETRSETVFHGENYQVQLAFLGPKIGFGSLQSSGGSIVNFGPAWGNIGEMTNFGISQILPDYKQLYTRKEDDLLVLKGWFKMAKRLGDSRSWLHFNCRATPETITFEWYPFSKGQKEYFVLFVRGEKVIVDGNYTLQPKSLDRHIGRAEKIEIKSKEDILAFFPKSIESFEIIPLAGGEFFWGADFLIAIPLTSFQKQALQITPLSTPLLVS